MTIYKTQTVFSRAFPVTINRNGTHLTGRLVPYNLVTDVADPMDNGDFDIYREGFRPGAFAPQVKSSEPGVVRKIGLIHRHDGGLGYLGPFVGLREQPDGLYGDVRIMPTKADDVAALLDEGVRELSVEFRLPKIDHTVELDGVRWRTKAHLDQVALEPKGAYSTAQVLAYRNEMDEQAKAQAQAEEQRKADEAAEQQRQADSQAEHERREREADEALERRRRWDELTGRLDGEIDKQREIVKTYGVTQPGGIGSVTR